jgi:hypothetical protein
MSSRRPTDALHLVCDVFKANDIDTIFGHLGIPATDRCRFTPVVIDEAVTGSRQLSI